MSSDVFYTLSQVLTYNLACSNNGDRGYESVPQNGMDVRKNKSGYNEISLYSILMISTSSGKLKLII